MQKPSLLLVLPLLAAVGACVNYEKSENPLSPSVAGPIPGVNITTPTPLEPRDNLRIAVGQQPITLHLANANTSGVRPLSYVVEIATDSGFANKVFVREGIVPGEGGQTELRLPDVLAPERTYYWRAKAQDGANSSDYSAAAFFTVYTPIVFGQPTPQSPIGDVQLSDATPLFTFVNASRTGPSSSVHYELSLATSASFFDEVTFTFVEKSGGSTVYSPGTILSGTQYFWRVRAYDSSVEPTVVGPYSTINSFRTAAAASSGPGPGPGPSGGSCASAGSEEDIVSCRRNQFSGFMSDSQIVSFLRSVAQDLNAAGKPYAPNYGILVKTSGTQCQGYSCDIICAGNGGSQKQWDVLIDVQGSQAATWDELGSIAVRTCEVQ